MTDLMSIGASGLRAYRDALGTVSDNIANAQTAGYVRRNLQLGETPGSSDMVLTRSATSPSGVTENGVQRSIDQWLVDDSRTSIGGAGRTGARLQWLQASESALDDGQSGVGQSLTGMFNAADALSSDPTNTAARSTFLSSVASTADAFRQTANDLQSVATGISTAAQTDVNDVNSNIAALHRVNEGLLRARDGSTNQASLMDERDQLLDTLSGSLPISVSYDAHGAASVRAGAANGPVLLDGPTVGTLGLTVSSSGLLSYDVGGTTVSPTSGSLAGLASAAATVSDHRSSLDQLAAQFASEINAAHAAGKDAQGNAGLALVNFSGTAASLSANALRPDQVAVADSTSDNGNMLAFASLRGPSGTEQGWTTLVSANAQTVATAKAEDSAASTRRDGAMAARAATSGVDLDHESADLLRFQQAYEGSARVIQVARETFQSILNAI